MAGHVCHHCSSASAKEHRTTMELYSHEVWVTVGIVEHCPSLCLLHALVAPTGRQFYDLTVLRGRNHLISILILLMAKFMPTCSYANIALGFKKLFPHSGI